VIPGQKIYCAGPMGHLTAEAASGWRDEATAFLEALRDPISGKRAYYVLNPLRGRSFLTGMQESKEFPVVDVHGDGWGREVVRRDLYDVLRADVVLFNFEVEGVKSVSIGSMFELAWAREHTKFALVVMKDGNLHDHCFVRDAASFIVPTLSDALEYLATVLNCERDQ
jgi:hypothetical protein